MILRVLFWVKLGVCEKASIVHLHFVKIIHVELPDEGGEAVVAKVFGQNDFLQFLLV